MRCFPYHEFLTAGLVRDYEVVRLTKVNTVVLSVHFKRETHFKKDLLVWWYY